MTLCLAYTRVSTDRQELSSDAQGEQVLRAAAYHQLAEPEIYSDTDTSGSLPFAEREEGAQMLERVREARAAGTEVTLLVPKVDRLGRDSIDVNQTVRLLDGLGVRVVFLDINVDTRTAMGRAFMQIAAVFAELELARIRERIKTVLDSKRARNHLVGVAPFGWNIRYTFTDGTLLDRSNAMSSGEGADKLDERAEMEQRHGRLVSAELLDNLGEQEWIVKMAALRRQRWSYGSIARHLNEQGVRSKTGRLWQQGNVHKVLTNDTVTAWLALQKETEAA